MSWEQFIDIGREAARDRAAERDRTPVACPNDGTPLEAGPDGALFCRFDGWRPDGALPN